MFTQVTEKLADVLQSLTALVYGEYSNVSFNAMNGDMISHFESSRISFNQNSELFLLYGLILLVSFIIGIGVYTFTHTKHKNKKQS
ncbi:MAG: hypothetical protein DHS20C07_20010 [Methyloligella sp.]|nr:MAG: hypothetical protein DHS20C07_20010 [Methyloligella sp.]